MDKQTSQVQGNIGDWTGLSDSGADLLGLGLALRRLDRLLQRAVALAQAAYGAEATADPYRGLYISGKEVEQLLARPPGAPLLWDGEDTPEEATAPFHPASSRLAWLQQIFHLSPFDLDVIILALAPEMDLRVTSACMPFCRTMSPSDGRRWIWPCSSCAPRRTASSSGGRILPLTPH